MSDPALNPGVNDSPSPSSARNSRTNRFNGLRGGNRRLNRLIREFTDTTIAFASSARITDTGSRMGRFEKNQIIEVEGSDLEDGQYMVDEIVTAAILDVVGFGISTDAAGPSVTLRSKNNRIRNRYALTVN